MEAAAVCGLRVEVVTTFLPDSVCRGLQEIFLTVCLSAILKCWLSFVVYYFKFFSI